MATKNTTHADTDDIHQGEQGARRRAAGITAIVGAVTMLIGTAFWVVSGTDLDAALEGDTIGEYLTDVAASSTLVTANLGFWILGVILLGLGGIMLSTLGDQDSPATAVARFAFTVGPAAGIVFFSVWLGIVLGLAPAHVAGDQVEAIALALGQAASIADWVATVVILSLGGAALAVAGRSTWVPPWLFRWAMLTAVLGALGIVGLMVGARTTLTVPIVAVGIGFMIASGITALRHDA